MSTLSISEGFKKSFQLWNWEGSTCKILSNKRNLSQEAQFLFVVINYNTNHLGLRTLFSSNIVLDTSSELSRISWKTMPSNSSSENKKQRFLSQKLSQRNHYAPINYSPKYLQKTGNKVRIDFNFDLICSVELVWIIT